MKNRKSRSICAYSLLFLFFLAGVFSDFVNAQEKSANTVNNASYGDNGFVITYLKGQVFARNISGGVWDIIGPDKPVPYGNFVRTGENGRIMLKGDGLFIKVAENATFGFQSPGLLNFERGSCWLYAREKATILTAGRTITIEEAAIVLEGDPESITAISVMEGKIQIDGGFRAVEGERARLIKGRLEPSMTSFVPRHIIGKWDSFVESALETVTVSNQHGVQVIQKQLQPSAGYEVIKDDDLPEASYDDLLSGRVPPRVLIDMPQQNERVGKEFRARGRIPSSGGVNGVDIYLNGRFIRNIPLVDGYFETIVENEKAFPKKAVFEARATDISGLTGTAKRDLVVDSSPPVITIVPLVGQPQKRQVIRGFVDKPDIKEVQILVNPNTRDERKYNARLFGFSFEIAIDLIDGVNVILAECSDPFGNVGQDRKTIRYSKNPLKTIYQF